VDDREDFDGARRDAIDQDVVGMDHGLARIGNSAGAVKMGMRRQAIGSVVDRLAKASRGGGPVRGDIANDVAHVLARGVAPDQWKHQGSLWRSRIACISAITCSCEMHGAVEASAFSTLARTQASCAASSSVEANSETMGESFAMGGI